MGRKHFDIEPAADTTQQLYLLKEASPLCVKPENLPPRLSQVPIRALNLPTRAYNCLAQYGYTTLGQVLALLPRGYQAVRGAGPGVWKAIEEAVTVYLAAQHIEWTPDVLAASASDEPDYSPRLARSTDVVGLPEEVVAQLKTAGITTLLDLSRLPLSKGLSLDRFADLTATDWYCLTQAFRFSELDRSLDISHHMHLDQHPLDRLGLTGRPLHTLIRAGVTTIPSLLQCTVGDLLRLRSFGIKCLMEVLDRLRDYPDVETLCDTLNGQMHSPRPSGVETTSTSTPTSDALCQTELLLETEAKTEAEISPPPPPISVEEQIEQWLASLEAHRPYLTGPRDLVTQREKTILCQRYGLRDGHPQTLEEIGHALGITRERVRQIEHKALRQLQKPNRRAVVRPLIECLEQALKQRGGLATQLELGEALVENREVGNIHPFSLVEFLLDAHMEFSKIAKTEGGWIWGLKNVPLQFLNDVEARTCAILATDGASLPDDELLRRFKTTEWYQAHQSEVEDEFIRACWRISSRVVVFDEGSYGLERWERQYQDEMVLALRQLGRPAHYSEIAEVVNTLLPPTQPITPRQAHIRLGQRPELFVWVGRRGMYGLKEWGLQRALTYEEALTQILGQARRPLTLPEVLAQLSAIRPHYDETSVVLTLSTNPHFRTFGGNSFGLAGWREEDFVSEDYRIQQLLLATDNPQPVKGPKRHILDTLNAIDDFLTQAREDLDP